MPVNERMRMRWIQPIELETMDHHTSEQGLHPARLAPQWHNGYVPYKNGCARILTFDQSNKSDLRLEKSLETLLSLVHSDLL
ncbi:hypothetical protein PGTUg99_031544 [Puccinia graminis f. sp. tritici]|uniref:Uncharacterized protein n=1 Tax=Puccinia graminis f. sp. tritici TaxID=56615 RepID=A0A5B0SJY5_PUCGR|nr:hypothetical protein PGTUg99_031544 [Puccinia graminis f. sp. tritici]